MIERFKTRGKDEPLVSLRVDKFDGGVNTNLSETRLKKEEAKEATNMILVEDGLWTKRWGTQAYGGVTFTNRPDGFTEYRKTDGTRELIVIADGKAWCVDPSASTKTELTGATFTTGHPCDFIQIKDVLYVVNGQDDMAVYGGSTFTSYSALTTPAWSGTPITRGAGLSSGAYTYYYRVSALNAVGESLAVAETSITVDIARGEWNEADEYLDLAWGAVSGALKYNIYFSDTSGYEVKLDESATNAYRDDGTATENPYIEPPLNDTSAGPKFKSIAVSGNRIWGTNDPNYPQRVYFTGTGTNLGNFATGYGGGWIDLERGGRTQNVKIVDYQGEAHIFCKTDDGKGAVWRVVLSSVDIAGTTVIVPTPNKLIPSIGTPSIRGAVQVENDIQFFNKDVVSVLGNEPGVLDVLRVNELSERIRNYIQGLYEPDLDKVCTYYKDQYVFYSVPATAGYPNKIIVYDREHKCWIKDWSIGVSQFGEFTDADGTTHFLGISSDRLIEFSSAFEGDSGTAFAWKYVSPRFSISEDWTQFAMIRKAELRVRNPSGSITFSLLGTGKNGSTSTVATSTITTSSSDTGIGWDQLGAVQFGSSSGVPTTFAQESLIRYINVRGMLREIQFELAGDGLSDNATLTGIAVQGRQVKTVAPEEWRLD